MNNKTLNKEIIKIYNDKSLRTIDENGFLHIEYSPILKSGILEYYGSELVAGDNEYTNSIDGVKIIPDKIYKVYIPLEELEKCKNSFLGKPIVNNHQWLGKEGENAKYYQEGSLGENLFVKDNLLMASLFFNNLDTIDGILNNKKTELSASYTNKLKKSNNPKYDFIAEEIVGNHVALVDNGRCGKDVRIYNNEKQSSDFWQKLKEFLKQYDETRIFNGGPGSGIKGHTTPKDETGNKRYKKAKSDENKPKDKKEIVVKGNELGDYSDIKELRKKAIDYYKKNIQGTSVKRDDIGEIRFSRKGLQEFKHNTADDNKLLVLPYIKDIILSGELGGEEKLKHPRKDNIFAFIPLKLDVKIRNQLKTVEVLVAKDKTGKLFYDCYVNYKRKTRSSTLDKQSFTTSNNIIKHNFLNVKTQNEEIEDNYELNIFFIDEEDNPVDSKEKAKLKYFKHLINSNEEKYNEKIKKLLAEIRNRSYKKI